MKSFGTGSPSLRPPSRNLDIYLEGVLQPGFAFTRPVTVAIHYSDADVVGIDENTLTLYRRNGEAWEDTACDAYDRHPDENWLAIPVCHLSEFALFGAVSSAPVGGYTEPMSLSALLWPLILLAATVVTGAIAALTRKRRAAWSG